PDQRLALNAARPARFLLIARQHDDKIHRLEQAGGGERLERVEHHDVATLHVDDARTARGRRIDALESLKPARPLEYGVEMPDEQDLRPGRPMLADQMARPADGGLIDPLRAEANAIELGAEDPSDLADTLQVHRPAVDVDDALEQRDCLRVRGVDMRDD